MRPAAPVDVEPAVRPDAWSLVVHPQGTVHVACLRLDTRRGQMSTAIASWDPDTLTAVTESGRHYLLTGARNDVMALVMAGAFWGIRNPEIVDPDDLPLRLAEAASGLRH